jgi:pimeloyl-ACP methyl ester carboxylesterase
VITDLSALLKAASVDGPYVPVGRSFGGMIVTYYAQEMPEDVLGVVVFDSPAPSAAFTEESEPELVWDNPGNTEHLDVVGGFENRFANQPAHIDVPLLLITPADGESSPKDQRFWLQVSDDSEQVTPPCECYAEQIIEFIAGQE